MITNLSSTPFVLKNKQSTSLWYSWKETCDICGAVICTEDSQKSSSPPDQTGKNACLKCMMAYWDADDKHEEMKKFLKGEIDKITPLEYEE